MRRGRAVVHDAVRAGDFAALRAHFNDEPGFPEVMDEGGLPLLTLAIYFGPPKLVAELLGAGADPRAEPADGFPALFAAMDREGEDRYSVMELLIRAGADPQQRGINDYTALHYAACRDDAPAILLLLRHGGRLDARTRIDDCTTPFEEARRLGCHNALAALSGADG